MSEKVSIDIDAADDLSDAYLHASRIIGDVADDIGALIAEANQLLDHCVSNDIVDTLHHVAGDLQRDRDDLRWRATYLQSIDGPIDTNGRRFDFLPTTADTSPPTNAPAAAERVATLVGTWTGADGQPATVDDLEDIRTLLTSVQHDPAWLGRFFRDLGPDATYQLSAMVSVLMREQITNESLHQTEPSTFDPSAFRHTLADSLATASHVTDPHRGHPTSRASTRPLLLGDDWFDELRDAGTTYHGEVAADWVHLFDTDNRIRTEWTTALATTGLEIADGQHQLELAYIERKDPHTGLWVLDTPSPREGELLQILFDPAQHDPHIAATVLVDPTSNGRTGAQIVAARTHDTTGTALANLTLAGTTGAMNASITNGTATDPALAEEAMRATGAVIEAIGHEQAHNPDRQPYEGARTLAFGEIIVAALPHFMSVGDTGLDTAIYTEGQPIPSASSGIEVEADNLGYALGALFRNEPMRNHIGAEANIAMRQLLLNPDQGDHQAVGEMNGVLVFALNNANISAADAQQAAIDNFNSTADQIWDTFEFVADEIPFGKPVVRVVREATSYLDVVGIDLQQEVIDAAFESSGIDTPLPSPEQARVEAQLNLDSAFRNANQTILAAELDRTQTLLANGTPVDDLPQTSITILDEMERAFGPDFTPGQTNYTDLSLNPTHQHRLASIAENLDNIPGFSNHLRAAKGGVLEALQR